MKYSMPCSEGTVSNFLGGLLKSKASSGAVARLSRYRRATMHHPSVPEKPIAQAVAMFVASDYLTGEILLSDDGLNLP